MSLKASFELMARYNGWMNQNILRATATLSAADIARDRGAFFGSILGTLNHLLVGDTIWLKRYASQLAGYSSLDYVRDLASPAALDVVGYRELNELKAARATLDEVIVRFAEELTEDDIATNLSYTSMKGIPATKPLDQLLLHFFNHQTHHRGQLTTLLTQAGAEVGATDLLVIIADE